MTIGAGETSPFLEGFMEKEVKIEILRDGVFVSENERRDTGAVETVPIKIADALVKSGHAKRK
jgi:hypothetical protein